MDRTPPWCSFFFFNDTATTEIYTLSLHDALPIYADGHGVGHDTRSSGCGRHSRKSASEDRKSTRLNSSHLVISYAVFCLKKKKNNHGIVDACGMRCRQRHPASRVPGPYTFGPDSL